MNVLVFGASGGIGWAVADELLDRGHTVTGVTRSGELPGGDRDGLRAEAGDVTDAVAVAALAKDHDAVITAVGPRHDGDDPPDVVAAAARSLIEALPRAGVRRLVVVGGAGSLRTPDGAVLMDTPDFPAAWRPIARAHSEALELYRATSDLEWSYLSPAALIGPGERSGGYRVGGDDLLVDEEGKSAISIADFAIAVVDELERGAAVRQRITVAY